MKGFWTTMSVRIGSASASNSSQLKRMFSPVLALRDSTVINSCGTPHRRASAAKMSASGAVHPIKLAPE
eukprot:CAMPEP_0115337638 /NCGR_PEP_ID=MMETSP0270-20121206/89638_1 /TAXON_ID=71861 /ORGANISM="Scrippsiella trochoidea, Strain CCMP3099" /LENGTH=68 /DNA_ID=CAMNT_0002758875 /DNA_START=54 /DNA_END=257 /DNA_ORIENTATION=+